MHQQGTKWGRYIGMEDVSMDQRKKKYVPVVVRFDTNGKLRPLVVEFDEEHRYSVDKVLDIR